MLVNRAKSQWFRRASGPSLRAPPGATKPSRQRHSLAASPPSRAGHFGSAPRGSMLECRRAEQSGVAEALPKLPRTAQLRPHALSTGRARPSLAWYLGGAAIIALVTTGGLGIYEMRQRSTASAAKPAPAAKVA